MPFFLLSVLIQIGCVVHIIRTGRNQMWLLAVVFLPIAGSIAYFALEIAPGLWGGREAQAVRAGAVKMLDPERELRAAADALKLTATPGNEIRCGEALVALGRSRDAVPHFEAALGGVHAGDRSTRFKLAAALLDSGSVGRALTIAEELPASVSSDGDRYALLRAKCLEALARPTEAMAIYADIVSRVPGEEVRCRYAALLIAAGRRVEARTLLSEVADRARRLTRRQRAAEARMYDWAAAELTKLA